MVLYNEDFNIAYALVLMYIGFNCPLGICLLLFIYPTNDNIKDRNLWSYVLAYAIGSFISIIYDDIKKLYENNKCSNNINV